MSIDTTNIWIPARRASTRLPAKLLRSSGGRPLIAYTLDRALEAAALLGGDGNMVRVVTDCEEIAQIAERAGVTWSMETAPCTSGTERLCNFWNSLSADARPEVIINLQGDEPLIPAEVVADLARMMWDRAQVAMGTVMRPGRCDAGAVSVVVDRRDRALYFSRHPLPGRHPTSTRSVDTERPAWGTHVGLYGYRGDTLGAWLDTRPGPLEMMEGLEQLRALEYGMCVAVLRARTSDGPWFSIDTEQDWQRFEGLTITGARV